MEELVFTISTDKSLSNRVYIQTKDFNELFNTRVWTHPDP
jgi:hypothetical protein